MNRRSFLKMLGIGALVPGAVAKAAEAMPVERNDTVTITEVWPPNGPYVFVDCTEAQKVAAIYDQKLRQTWDLYINGKGYMLK